MLSFSGDFFGDFELFNIMHALQTNAVHLK